MSSPSSSAAQPSTPGYSARILVVDDFEADREVMEEQLIAMGHRVELAVDGNEAMLKVGQEEFDLIMLDSMMPSMPGDEVLEQLKCDTTLRNIPVIIVSGKDDLHYISRCIQLGAEDYLPKPCNPVLLNARVNASLRKKRMHDQEKKFHKQVSAERRRADRLLSAQFPQPVVQELKARDKFEPRRFVNVAVLFCDLSGFTAHCDQHEPEDVVRELQQLFEIFEKISADHGVEKIKTIGDAFMGAAGLMQSAESPVLNCIRCGVDMIEAAQGLPSAWSLTVGIHSGPVVGGVVGRKQYQFDIWGSTVNTAARIQSLADPNCVDVGTVAWQEVSEMCHGKARFERVKGLGELEIVRFERFL